MKAIKFAVLALLVFAMAGVGRAQLNSNTTTTAGLAVVIRLPHIVYQCESAKNCRDNVRKGAGL
jgi:hypothetical protein